MQKQSDKKKGDSGLADDLLHLVESKGDKIEYDRKGNLISSTFPSRHQEENMEQRQTEPKSVLEPTKDPDEGVRSQLNDNANNPPPTAPESQEETQPPPQGPSKAPEEQIPPQEGLPGPEEVEGFEEAPEGPHVHHVTSDPPPRFPHENWFSLWLHSHPIHESEHEWHAAKMMGGFKDLHTPEGEDHDYADEDTTADSEGSQGPEPHQEPEPKALGGEPEDYSYLNDWGAAKQKQ